MKLPFFTFINSLAISVTYLESGSNFFWHNGWADEPLIASEEVWAPYVLTVLVVMCGFIGVSNQLGMSARIAKFVNQLAEKEVLEIKGSKSLSRLEKANVIIGSVSKALISTTSLLSSVRDLTGGLVIPISVASVCMFGNFLAVWVVLMENNGMRLNWRKQNALVLSYMVGITYSVSQLCIYSNSLFNPLLLTGVLSKRPGWFNTDSIGRIIYGAAFLPRFEFTLGSGQAIFAITKKVFGSEEEGDEKKNEGPTAYQKLRGGVAAAYKSVALFSSIFGLSYFLSDQNLVITVFPTLLGILAVPGVVAVLYPVKETRLSENHVILLSAEEREREEMLDKFFRRQESQSYAALN